VWKKIKMMMFGLRVGFVKYNIFRSECKIQKPNICGGKQGKHERERIIFYMLKPNE
jgi:hypothetical protein